MCTASIVLMQHTTLASFREVVSFSGADGEETRGDQRAWEEELTSWSLGGLETLGKKLGPAC
jgi:hypothetical protein